MFKKNVKIKIFCYIYKYIFIIYAVAVVGGVDNVDKLKIHLSKKGLRLFIFCGKVVKVINTIKVTI